MATPKLTAYRAKRDFTKTQEPSGEAAAAEAGRLRFVVQRHAATRLHYDLRLELDGVFKSWAVAKGPSVDPHDKRLAVEVEDHPLDYGDFEGTIPKGQYGGGTVQLWDRGYWTPEHMTAEEGLAGGDLKFTLEGERLHGSWVLVRMKKWSDGKRTNWLLIKHRDEHAREGDDDALLVDASVASGRAMAAIAAGEGRAPTSFMTGVAKGVVGKAAVWDSKSGLAADLREHGTISAKPKKSGSKGKAKASEAPADGAIRGAVPESQAPQLATLAEEPPTGAGWVSEIKFDGYRILAVVEDGKVRLLTRNGHDWAERMPAVAKAIAELGVGSAVLDGELVWLQPDGVSSFPGLQAALKAGRDNSLTFFAFDLLHLDGWDLRGCSLLERKRVLAGLNEWTGMLRYSDHHVGESDAMRRQACHMHLEGIICKQADAVYEAGRGRRWLKLKCSGREEFVVLGYTPPANSRVGIGALHVGYNDPDGGLHYAGGVGSGFDTKELKAIRARLDGMAAPAPEGMQVSGDPIDTAVTWVRPEMVIEVQFTGWSGAGRVRHAVYLGTREDKSAAEVVRDVADADAPRVPFAPRKADRVVAGKRRHVAVPPIAKISIAASNVKGVVVAQAPKKASVLIAGVSITHADRELWPGISKRDLAEYWQAVAEAALPGIAHRPLSILRCPEGIGGREQFFQKNGHGIMPAAIREGSALKQPFLALDDVEGLAGMAQMSAIELHTWGSSEAAPASPDRLVFDLDPGEGVVWAEVVRAAHDTCERLRKLGLESWCRTTGGKGLHVVVPLAASADWSVAKPFCRAFAELMGQEEPTRFLAHLKIADRAGRILVDWLRNGPGATAVASFSPRARDGATVATPVSWAEVTPKLDPKAFTVRTVPRRIAELKSDPWAGFAGARQRLPALPAPPTPETAKAAASGSDAPRARIVTAARPKRRD